jgi:hypothetical protein
MSNNTHRPCQIQFIRILLIVASVTLLAQCGPSAPYIVWEYIIPDNYTGYLAIRYNCPGGVPLTIKDSVIRVKFKSDGTYCTSDSFSASWSDGDRAWTSSGTPIPVDAGSPWDQTGYEVCCGGTRVIGGNTWVNPGDDIILDLQWVGDMKRVAASWPGMPDSSEDFFVKRFGLRDMKDYPTIKVTPP